MNLARRSRAGGSEVSLSASNKAGTASFAAEPNLPSDTAAQLLVHLSSSFKVLTRITVLQTTSKCGDALRFLKKSRENGAEGRARVQ